MYVPSRDENEKPRGIFDGFDPLRYSVRVSPGPQHSATRTNHRLGLVLTHSTQRRLCARPKMTTGSLSPKTQEEGHVHGPSPSPLLFYFEQADKSPLLALGWPHITRGVSTTAPARQAAPGYGCTAAARRSPSSCDQGARADRYCMHLPRCLGLGRWAGGQGGPRPLAAGKLWEFLSLGGEGSSPRLLPIPFFREQRFPLAPHACGLGLGVAAPPIASDTFGLAPSSRAVSHHSSQYEVPPVQSHVPDDTKGHQNAQNLAVTPVQWPHTEKRYVRRSRSKRRSSNRAV